MCATSSRNSPVHIRLHRRGEGGEGRSIYSKLFVSNSPLEDCTGAAALAGRFLYDLTVTCVLVLYVQCSLLVFSLMVVFSLEKHLLPDSVAADIKVRVYLFLTPQLLLL